jgi:hypothetical protein
MYTNNPNSSVRVKYAIVHITKGRVRIRIPKLKYDREYQCCLKKLVESFKFVTGVRINPAAQSIVIHYDQWASTFVSLQKKLATAIQQAANIDLSVPTSVQSTPSLHNGASKERFSLERNANSSLDSTCSSFVKSKEKSTDKRFRIVFWQTGATARPIRSSKHEKIVDYNRISQQIQTIHRAGGKILSIRVISSIEALNFSIFS